MQLLESQNISKDHYLLKFKCNAPIKPGQFVEIKVNNLTDPLLRRPISIFNYEDNQLEIVVQKIGKATDILCSSKDDSFDIIGPLGKGFTLVQGEKVLLIGGGVGNAPLYYLGKALKNLNCNITYIYGSRSSQHAYLLENYKAFCNEFHITTDDGSIGQKGFASDILKEIFQNDYSAIYTCGPLPMMKAIHEIIGNANLEVSLENYFGCGIGICSGCTIETVNGLRQVCKDGPVFKASQLMWESLTAC